MNDGDDNGYEYEHISISPYYFGTTVPFKPDQFQDFVKALMRATINKDGKKLSTQDLKKEMGIDLKHVRTPDQLLAIADFVELGKKSTACTQQSKEGHNLAQYFFRAGMQQLERLTLPEHDHNGRLEFLSQTVKEDFLTQKEAAELAGVMQIKTEKELAADPGASRRGIKISTDNFGELLKTLIYGITHYRDGSKVELARIEREAGIKTNDLRALMVNSKLPRADIAFKLAHFFFNNPEVSSGYSYKTNDGLSLKQQFFKVALNRLSYANKTNRIAQSDHTARAAFVARARDEGFLSQEEYSELLQNIEIASPDNPDFSGDPSTQVEGDNPEPERVADTKGRAIPRSN